MSGVTTDRPAPRPGRRPRAAWGATAACALAVAGCYHYVPADPAEPRAGTPVRVQLEPPGSFELPGLTAHDVLQIEGEMITSDPEGLFLSATWLDAAGGRGFPGSGWTVRVDERSVRSFEAREISWLRTGLALVGLAVGTWTGFEAIEGSGGGGGRSRTGGRPN